MLFFTVWAPQSCAQKLRLPLTAVFEVLDTNKDGEINEEDILLLMKRLRPNAPRQTLENAAAQLTALLPKDAGNIITQQTFVNMLKEVPGINEVVGLHLSLKQREQPDHES